MNLIAERVREASRQVSVATQLGKYTRISVDASAQHQARQAREDHVNEHPQCGPQSLLKLMIVDDSNIIRRRIEHSQQIARLEVVGSASNGREAVELFRRTHPDVVTMDLTMPEMDGIECVAGAGGAQFQGADSRRLGAHQPGDRGGGHREGRKRLYLQAVHRSAAERRAARICCWTLDVLKDPEIHAFIEVGDELLQEYQTARPAQRGSRPIW